MTGHSLGGALSTIAGVSIERAFPGGKVRGIGFASPRVGNPAFAQFVNNAFGDRYKRVTHTADNVPQDLTPAEGYQAVATEYWISRDPASPANIIKCNGGEDPNCNNSVGQPNAGIGGINAVSQASSSGDIAIYNTDVWCIGSLHLLLQLQGDNSSVLIKHK